jgi:YD repeat-containing protein
VKARGFTHVSVHAYDLEESARFYKEVFGMEEIPAPNFSSPVRWLRVGDLQLHLFESDVPAPARHHFGIDVDDFEAAYRKAKELGIGDELHFPADVYELPDGAVQMYVRDPAGNLVEVNWPDVTTLDRAVVTGIVKRDVPQTGDALRATLYLRKDRAPG